MLSMSRLRFPGGIAGVLTLSITLVIVVLIGVTTILDIRRTRDIYKDEMEQRGLSLASTLNDVMADPLYFYDVDDLDDLTDVVKGNFDVEFIHVFRPDGSPLASSEPGDYPVGPPIDQFDTSALEESRTIKRESDQLVEFASPIQIGRETIGGVHFGFTTAPLESDIAALTRQRILQGLALIAVGIVASYGLAQYFIKPLRRLVGATKSIASGDLVFPAERRRSDEIGDLTEAFARMTASLKESQDELTLRHNELNDAYQQMQALSDRLASVQEEERARIARDVHDDLGQFLTGLKLEIASLQSQVLDKTKETPEAALIDRFETLSKDIDSTIDTVRRISSDLRPTVLDHFGLVAAIEWQAQDFEDRVGIACTLDVPSDETEFDSNVSISTFRILQESLTNIARHAEATHVEIILGVDDEFLSMEVQDNGNGIDGSAVYGSRSLGLMGMRERARMHGGTVEVTGCPDKGTTVTLRIPLTNHSNNGSGLS